MNCGTCSTIDQVCKSGEWVDVDGECVKRDMCTPGEIWDDERTGTFDCGSYHIMARCDANCLFTEELPTVFVSTCSPTECCGSAPGARVACLDPDNLPEEGFCRTSAPGKDAVGDDWMTARGFQEYLKKLRGEKP